MANNRHASAKSPRKGQSDTADVQRAAQSSTTVMQWLGLIVIVTVLPYLMSRLHYTLPKPLPPFKDGRPQPSEELVLGHVQALETIGYRTVGTPQARAGEEYVEAQVRDIERRCNEDGVLQCDVWIQTGDGFHEFTIMDHDVLKVYKGITNVILRMRAKNPPTPKITSKDAMLLGAHIDSTLPAPGAADDGIGVAVLLDIARVLVDRKEPFDNSVIFLWNGGEETLQDGSHLYTTQHETAKEVRAAINLEAAGTTGGAMLFQATSKEMVEAFAYAPHPRGTVIAADIFASGVMMSDTDFGQFEEYLNVSGLDMAIVGHSYFYHTQKDRLEFIEPGAAQHFASNVMAILDHLLSPISPLHSDEPWSPPDMVYISLYDRVLFMYSMRTASKAYVALAAIVFGFTARRVNTIRPGLLALSLAGVPLGQVAGLLSANLAAGIMVLLNKKLSWFKHEHLCMVLFVPAGYIGYYGVQRWISTFFKGVEHHRIEQAAYHAQMVYSTLLMLLFQRLGIRSAYVFAMLTGVMLVGLLGDYVTRPKALKGSLGFDWTYRLSFSANVVLGVEAVTTTLDIFTPLVGRMGKDAPAEFIIATLSSVCAFTFFPTAVPLFHRLSHGQQRNAFRLICLFTLGVIVLFAGPWWKTYDSMHPKRAGVQYTYNHTTSTTTANVAFMDSGPEFDFVDSLHARYGIPTSPLEKTVMNNENPDWDVLYPVSSFLDTYRFKLPAANFDWPKMGIDVQESKMIGRRKLDLRLDFTGLVWPTLAFNAEILEWSFDFPPPKDYGRHHLKIATSVDQPIVDLSLTIADTEDAGTGSLSIHWIAIDLNQMVPGTAAEMGPDMPGSRMLMDVQEWAKEKYDDSLEILTIAAVSGIVEV